MTRSLVGTSDYEDATLRIKPGDATHTIDEVTGYQLDSYCIAMQHNMYPLATIRWETARLDNDVVVIHCFDAAAGMLYRTLQPASGGGWEALNATTADAVLARAPNLLALALGATIAHENGERPGPTPIPLGLVH